MTNINKMEQLSVLMLFHAIFVDFGTKVVIFFKKREFYIRKLIKELSEWNIFITL